MDRLAKVIALLFGVCVSLALTSCGEAVDNYDTAIDDYENAISEDYRNEAWDDAYNIAERADLAPFTGEIVSRDEFFSQGERDQDWEADV